MREDGELICDKCNGSGKVVMYDLDGKVVMLDADIPLEVICTKCRGEGKLDWVENVLGKKVEWKWGDGESD